MESTWTVVLVEEVAEWYLKLCGQDPATADLVELAIDLLGAEGPDLGRPMVDTIKGSKLHNLKELRPGSTARTEIRILFVFDSDRKAVLLVAGDKSRQWTKWYSASIPLAERRFQRWVGGEYGEEIE